jgi:FkbM family methyltransferase
MRKIFLDCGTNLGDGLLHFNKKYNFGPDWEIYLFEPNPYLKDFILEKIVSKNPAIPMHFLNRAVCGKDSPEKVTFNLQKIPEYENPVGGGSTLMSENDGLLSGETSGYESVEVETIRLSHFLFHLMQNHIKQENGMSVFLKGECMVVIKLDIEGTEYEVMQDLLDTGAAWAITDLHVEFHGRRFKMNKREEEIRLVGEFFQRGTNMFPHF